MNSMKESSTQLFIHDSVSERELLEQYIEDYRRADQFVKQVEEFNARASIPSLNELRYAGYHATNFLQLSISSGSSAEKNAQISKAINHCRRSAYDAGEAGISVALERLRIFKEYNKQVQITSVVPDWLDCLKLCEEVRAARQNARKSGVEQVSDLQDRMVSFEKLAQYCVKADLAQDELSKKANDDRRASRRTLLGLVLAALAIVVPIAFEFSP